MTPDTPPTEPRRRRRTHWMRWMVVVAVVITAWGGWKRHDFTWAEKEAKALGWEWKYNDPIAAIRNDWRAAFRKATWVDNMRILAIRDRASYLPNYNIVRRLDPEMLIIAPTPDLCDMDTFKGLTSLQMLSISGLGYITSIDVVSPQHTQFLGEALALIPYMRRSSRKSPEWCENLTNVDGLKGLSSLKMLDLSGCKGLTSVDALKGLTSLKELRLGGCIGLTNVDGLKGLSSLKMLDLSGCKGLTSVDALKGLTSLKELRLGGCIGLTNVDALKGFSSLKTLDLSGCKGLTNVDGLKGLPSLEQLSLDDCPGLTNLDVIKSLPPLKIIDLNGCTGLPHGTRDELRAAGIFVP